MKYAKRNSQVNNSKDLLLDEREAKTLQLFGIDVSEVAALTADDSASSSSDKDWVQKLVEIYSSGGSDEEICAELKITMDQFSALYRTDADFKKLVDIGRVLSKAWWYRQGRENVSNRNFNSSLYNFQMKNRFGWSERGEPTQGIDDAEVDLESARMKALTIIERIAKFTGDAAFSHETKKHIMRNLNNVTYSRDEVSFNEDEST